MHSRRLAWVFGESRLISSARTTFASSRAGVELEPHVAFVEHVDAGDVGRQQVRRELDPCVVRVDRACEGVGQRGLADAGAVLDHDVAIGEQRDEAGLDHVLLAEDDRGDVGRDEAGEACHFFDLGLTQDGAGRCGLLLGLLRGDSPLQARAGLDLAGDDRGHTPSPPGSTSRGSPGGRERRRRLPSRRARPWSRAAVGWLHGSAGSSRDGRRPVAFSG